MTWTDDGPFDERPLGEDEYDEEDEDGKRDGTDKEQCGVGAVRDMRTQR